MRAIKILSLGMFVLFMFSSCVSSISTMSAAPSGTNGFRAINRGPAPMGNNLAGPSPIYSKEKVVKTKIKSNYQQDSKEAIKKRLFASARAWNNKNTELFLSFFAEDARIMVGREQRIVTKSVYATMFPDAFDEAGKVKYDSLSVNVIDSKTAEVEGAASISADRGIIRLNKELLLIKRDNQWLIKESFFTVYFKGDFDPRDRLRPRGGESL